jgi:hypothetical protein
MVKVVGAMTNEDEDERRAEEELVEKLSEAVKLMAGVTSS